MKKYLYSYQTIIRFQIPVRAHFFLLRCMPCINACQRTDGRELFLHPSDYLTYDTDTWGNPIQYGSRMDPHDSFIFVSGGEAYVDPYCLPEKEARAIFRVQSRLTELTDPMRLFLAEDIREGDPLEQAIHLSGRIYAYMRYTPGSTQVQTTAAEAFARREGVCQDYAHILIALCRAQGIPARYVNGFLQGIGATHAWVEVFDKGAWWGIDPTNNRRIEYGYIKLSHGRDALDCPVIRGIFTGATTQQVEVRVIVEEI